MDRRLRILLFAVIMGFLVFGMLFQMMFSTRQRQQNTNLPIEQQSRQSTP